MHTPGLFPLEISIAERPSGNYTVEIRLTDMDGIVAMLTVAYEIEGRGCLFPTLLCRFLCEKCWGVGLEEISIFVVTKCCLSYLVIQLRLYSGY